MNRYVDFYGHPISSEERWSLLSSTNTTILKTDAEEYIVETVWIGLEDRVFVTRATSKQQGALDTCIEFQHGSLLEAGEGHKIAVEACLALSAIRAALLNE